MQLDAVEKDFRKRLTESCSDCVHNVFAFLMDPQTQSLMEPWLVERKGLLQLHVHAPGVLHSQHTAQVITFMMILHITKDVPILYFTPEGRTVLKAFKNLEETIKRESKRLEANPNDVLIKGSVASRA